MAFSQYLNFDLTYYFLICRNSYRCGIFFAGDNIGDPPRFKIFVIPKRFELDCGRSEEILKSEVKDECNELVSFHFRIIEIIIMKKWEQKLTYSMAIRVVEFSCGGTKLEGFLPMNQYTQRKGLNFEDWCNGEVSKSAKIWLSKSIFYVKNYQKSFSFLFHWRIQN